MERRVEINFSLVLILSVVMHVFIVICVVAPQYTPSAVRRAMHERAAMAGKGTGMKDVIVNLNADDKLVEDDTTLLSDKDSSARGHITKDYGDNWLNNSQEFKLPHRGSKGQSGSSSGSGASGSGSGSGRGSGSGVGSGTKASSHGDDTDIYPISLTLLHDSSLSGSGSVASMAEDSEWTRIPDKKGINRSNALYLSSDGAFSYNTKKFADFEYFRQMKNKVSGNWYPPNFAAGVAPEQPNSQTGMYTPGYTAYMMVPSQEVKLYFTMDRAGNVLDVVIEDSMGNESLDDSCVKSIRNSKNFGAVPADMKGSVIVIPFMFGYYVY
jgi:TonB family protein